MNFFVAYAPTVVVGALVIALLLAAARKIYSDKKEGKGGCGGGCSGCPGAGTCKKP